MTPFLFVANFKMNPATMEEAEEYLRLLNRESSGKTWNSVIGVLCPSFLHMSLFRSLPAPFFLGAQHGFPEKSGSYTGEVSFAMLKNMGVEYVILGHSERRQFFGETDESIRMYTEAALKFLLKPIVCVGETAEELAAGRREMTITRQLEAVLAGLSKMQAEKIIFAYEPRFAIGTNRVPTTEEITEVHTLMRTLLLKHLGEASTARIQIIYGGSVKASNLSEVAFAPGLDGVLVGKEALSPYEVVKMMDLANNHQENKRTTI